MSASATVQPPPAKPKASFLERGTRSRDADGAGLYETPECAVMALLHAVPDMPRHLWDPAAGKGAIAAVLRREGHIVTATELHKYPGALPMVKGGKDFFQIRRAHHNCHCILTNPPYDCIDDFVRHAIDLVPTVYILARLAFFEGTRRNDIMDNHLTEVFVGKERLPMMHRAGWSGNRLPQSTYPFAWFHFERYRPHQHVKTYRISWR